MQKIGLGRVQMRIMRVLWEKKQATAREITEELSCEKHIAHSTVQTLLRKLEEKGAVGHEIQGRTFTFKPKVDQGLVTQGVIQDFISRIFHGDAAELAMHLVKHERLSKEELAQIRTLINEREKKA
ncbi:MAG: BlaI/MecI/CopY family transcriptional regulator [Blastochloris sp.]|nr:BlaI/MecI/CopY family transcriptional regulator [Blastochloris sp.]